MHLAVLLFLTGVASAYPLKPAQASQLVPRDLPQPHCFRAMPDGTLPALDPLALTAMANCMRQPDVVGFLRKPPKRLQEYRQIWRNKQGEPPECVIPMDKNNYELGFCFVRRRPPSPPANQPPQQPPRQFVPILPRPPEANAAHPPASQANATRPLAPLRPRPQINRAAQAPPPPRPSFPPPQHPPLNLSPQAGHPSHGQTSPPPRKGTHPKEFPTTISNYSDWGFPPR